jgi:hypothetical protein
LATYEKMRSGYKLKYDFSKAKSSGGKILKSSAASSLNKSILRRPDSINSVETEAAKKLSNDMSKKFLKNMANNDRNRKLNRTSQNPLELDHTSNAGKSNQYDSDLKEESGVPKEVIFTEGHSNESPSFPHLTEKLDSNVFDPTGKLSSRKSKIKDSFQKYSSDSKTPKPNLGEIEDMNFLNLFNQYNHPMTDRKLTKVEEGKGEEDSDGENKGESDENHSFEDGTEEEELLIKGVRMLQDLEEEEPRFRIDLTPARDDQASMEKQNFAILDNLMGQNMIAKRSNDPADKNLSYEKFKKPLSEASGKGQNTFDKEKKQQAFLSFNPETPSHSESSNDFA